MGKSSMQHACSIPISGDETKKAAQVSLYFWMRQPAQALISRESKGSPDIGLSVYRVAGADKPISR